jgi:hypothetical protein
MIISDPNCIIHVTDDAGRLSEPGLILNCTGFIKLAAHKLVVELGL